MEARKEAERTKAKNAAALAAQVKAAVALAGAVAADKPLREAAEKAEAAFAAAKQNADWLTAEIAAAPAKLAAIETAANSCAGELMAAKEAMTAKGAASTVLAEAAAKAAEAAAKLPNDAEIKTATAAVKARADAAAAEIAALQKAATDAQAKTETTQSSSPTPGRRWKKRMLNLAAAQPQLPALEAEAKAARAKANETAAPVDLHARRSPSRGAHVCCERTAALAPEQLCWSYAGDRAVRAAPRAAVKEWTRKTNGPTRTKLTLRKWPREAGIEKLFREKLRGHEDQYASFRQRGRHAANGLFATPEQALYFENGSVRVHGRNQARAAAIPEPKAMAEELYLATLTRMPADAEVAELAATIAARPPEKKAEALTDYTWALITSVEFRFAH